MKCKIIINTAFLVILFGSISSCRVYEPDEIYGSNKEKSSRIDPIPIFFDKNVTLATGFNFQTGEPVVLNPITGEELNPLTDAQNTNCNSNELIIFSDKNSSHSSQNQLDSNTSYSVTNKVKNKPNNCNTNIVDPTQELANAIKSSEKIINGTIRQNGKDIPARFIVSITALYQGSDCSYYIVDGKQYNFCSDTITNCNLVAPILNPDDPGYAGSTNGSYRRAVRKVCRQFPAWKSNDCNYLKTRYKTGFLGSIYPVRYKQYIWKTCNTQPAWGPCPPLDSNDPNVSECRMPKVTP